MSKWNLVMLIWWLYVTNGQLQYPLRELADKRRIFIGTALNYFYLQENMTYATIAPHQYSLMTPENGCKFAETEPNANQFNFTQCDFDYNYAKKNNMTFRGHNLCWGEYNPTWLTNGGYSPSELQSILQNHITTVIQHYHDKEIYSWDVVNEAVNDNPSNEGLYKSNVWYPAIPNYVNIAFQTARKANPNIKLFYNDINILMGGTDWMADKSNAVYNMIKNMTKEGIPIDGIGFETHLQVNPGEYPLDYDNIITNFQRFAALGLEIHITEMDIKCDCSSFSSQIELEQAQMYQTVLRACLAVPNCKNFESWGWTDKYTWIGSNEYPLPFDINFNPKTAAFYIEQQLLNTTA